MKKDFSYKNTLKIISIYFSGFYFVFGTLSSFVYVKYFITHSWQRVPLPKLYVDPLLQPYFFFAKRAIKSIVLFDNFNRRGLDYVNNIY